MGGGRFRRPGSQRRGPTCGLRTVATTGVALLGLCALPFATRADPGSLQTAAEATRLLDRYAAGEFDAVVAIFAAHEHPDDLRKDLEDHGQAWTEAGGPDEVPRRRLAAATFALELASTRMLDEWKRLRGVVEWGCALLRQGARSDGERVWQLASVAVAQGARDWKLLYADPPPQREPSVDHLWWHARDRFKDEIRLEFADAVTEALRHAAGWPRRGERPGTPSADSLRNRFAAIDLLQTFAGDPVVGAEAELRTGVAYLRLHDFDAARRHFELASRGTDGFIAYLAHLFAGRLQEGLNAPDVAAAHYRRALEVLPRAQSASLALSALLLAGGEPDEAYALMEAVFERPLTPDPWRLYGLGDYHRLPDYLDALHREIRR